MAVRKINESTLTAIGNAIRSKTGGNSLIAPEDMPTEIGNIQTGLPVYQARYSNAFYVPKTVIEITAPAAWEIPTTIGGRYWFAYAEELEELTIKATGAQVLIFDNSRTGFAMGCTKLKKCTLDCAINYLTGANLFANCTALEEITIGNVGKPMGGNRIASNIFETCSSLSLITFYVNAETLADVPSNLTSNQPFGAANATVVYRSATTGEVITP